MDKHAFIIMAHDNFFCLERLLVLLDDCRNDIFLHIDVKVKNFDFDYFRKVCSKAQIIYPSKRMNVCWGTQSQVKTEMLMLKTATNYGPYLYYHIISGSDLPLMNQDQMHQWFAGKTKSYIYYTQCPSMWDLQRVSRYNYVFGNGKNKVSRKLNALFSNLQEWLKVDRTKGLEMRIQKGGNWASLTQQAVEVLVGNEAIIMKLTRYSRCADEIYKQTILIHNNCPIVRDNLRLIRWEDENHPHTYLVKDFDFLSQSDKVFARKFHENVDKNIIDMIYCRLRGSAYGEKS